MKKSSLVRRYARALVLAMADEEEFRRVQRDLDAFIGLLAADENLKIGLETSLISQAEKAQALEIVALRMGLDAKTRHFLLTVAAENRMAFLVPMAQQLPEAWCSARDIERIDVASVVELTPGQRQRLRANLEKALARKVKLDFQQEPGLVAGLRLSRGSVHYDFSLAGSLQKLREALVGDR